MSLKEKAFSAVRKTHFPMKWTARTTFIGNRTLVLFGDGKQVSVSTEKDPVRFLLVSGKPIGEPVAWYGPIVMNTNEELETAFEEFNHGTFIKHRAK